MVPGYEVSIIFVHGVWIKYSRIVSLCSGVVEGKVL